MINLSNRLLAIASFVDKEDNVIDIGCDHALLDIYLKKKLNNKIIIASDILNTALDNARSNIKRYNCKNIILKCGNGLDTLKETEVNTIIISGMGYQKIIGILKNGESKLKNIDKIIIQSNTFPNKVRYYLTKNGYFIYDEKLVKEKNIIYTTISFKKGNKKYNKLQIEYGPILIERKEKIFFEYIDIEIKKINIILRVLPKRDFIRKIKLKLELKRLICLIKE